MVGLRRVGSSWTGNSGGYFRAGILAVIVSFAGNSAIGQNIDRGIEAPERGDYQAALKEILSLAEQGDAVAQNKLGVMYDNGEGVLADDQEAVRWYRLATDQGDATAQRNLGDMYNNGEGVLADDQEAVRLYRLAADQGDAPSQYYLGVMYDTGEGVFTDRISAHMWLIIAGENGFEMARERREKVEKTMLPADISAAVNSARTCMSSGYKNCR